ncbi:grifin isoform X1 [Sigmodon hispidus]
MEHRGPCDPDKAPEVGLLCPAPAGSAISTATSSSSVAEGNGVAGGAGGTAMSSLQTPSRGAMGVRLLDYFTQSGVKVEALGWVGFEAFCAEGLAPGWSLTVQGHADAGTDKFEINFITDTGDIAFHIKPRFSNATVVGNAFQGGCWGQEEVSSVFPLTLGEPFEMEVNADTENFHIYAQEHKVLQFPHRHRPLSTITRVRVLSDHPLAQVELAKRSLNWGDGSY